MTDIGDIGDRIDEAIRSMNQEAREASIRLLDLRDDERARAIGRLHQSGRGSAAAELLMDVFGDEGLRRYLLTELRLAGLPRRHA